VIARGGALVVETGVPTGHSPKDKFIVAEALTEDTIWWDNCGRMSKGYFDALLADFLDHAKGKEIFAQDLHGGAPIRLFGSTHASSRRWRGTRCSIRDSTVSPHIARRY
jgi:ATP-dependent phosphoenolpyruvate carboxykinase